MRSIWTSLDQLEAKMGIQILGLGSVGRARTDQGPPLPYPAVPSHTAPGRILHAPSRCFSFLALVCHHSSSGGSLVLLQPAIPWEKLGATAWRHGPPSGPPWGKRRRNS